LTNLRRGALLIWAILIIALKYTSAQNPYIQHYTTSNGLPSNCVFKVFQDSKKFIWFGTDAGLARFDGNIFTYYRKNNGLSGNDVFNIKEDSKGRIWFFNLNAINYFYDNTIFNGKNSPFLDSLYSEDIFRNFYEDEAKTIYFYHNKERVIYSLDSLQNITKIRLPSIIFKNDINPMAYEAMDLRFICKTKEGEFLLFSPAGIFKTRDLKEKPILYNEEYKIINAVQISDQSCYLIARKKYCDTFKIKKFTDKISSIGLDSDIQSISNFISSILMDSYGILWVSTFDKGVFCYQGNKIIRHFDIKDAKVIIQDHEGNIWISSHKDGVFKINPLINKHLQYENSMFQNEGIVSISNESGGGIWCTNGKTIFLLKNNQLYTLNFQRNQQSFNQLLQVNNRTLIVGENGTLQYAIKGIRVDSVDKKVFFDDVVASSIPMKNINLSNKGDEICSFDQFRLLLLDPGHLFGQLKNINIGERINYTFYDANDELFINTRKTYLYKKGKLTAVDVLSYFDNRLIADHLNLRAGIELFNIEGDSLFLLGNKQIYNLSASPGFPSDLHIKNLDYQHPALCIATNSNIYICENPLNILNNKPAQFKPIDINFRNIHDVKFNGSKLYIASDDGLTCIPICDIHGMKANPPLPYIQSVQINDKENLVGKHQVTSTGIKRINISFSSINYSLKPIIFSYKLKGSDTDWTIVNGNNVVLQNLPTGRYIFKLRARKPNSPWSTPVEFGINIKPTVWQHPIFYIFIVLLSIGLVFLGILRRKNIELKHRHREHQLIILEQKSLQAMMNPHFIFNSLVSIQNYLLHNKPNEAGIYLSQFARLIRQNLSAINSAMINLEEEVDRLKNYLDLERLRLENKFDYSVGIDESVESEEILIPSMIIQPFVENSIWHGIANSDLNGFISIFFILQSEKSLKINIEDTGVGIINSEKNCYNDSQHLKIGMQITRKRLMLLSQKFGVETSIVYSEKSPGSPNPGTRVTIIVPFMYNGLENQREFLDI